MNNLKPKINPIINLTFDDVLLIPHYSNILPDAADVSTNLTKKINLKIPILSAAMDTITETQMAICLALNGGMGIIHKNMSLNEQIKMINDVKNFNLSQNQLNLACVDEKQKLRVGVAIGISDVNDHELTYLKKLITTKVDVLVLDSAHAHTESIMNEIKKIKKFYPYVQLIVGNIATTKAAVDLINLGVDGLKVGIGPGSICTTRIVSGVGVPQLSAIANVVEVARKHNIPVIADGGIKYSGDITKALAIGANAVMLGNVFAGTDESPGEVVEINGQKYKNFRGMGSISAMKKGSSARYFQKNSSKFVPEGVEAFKLHKGSVQDVIYQMIGGLKSGMGYLGAINLTKLYEHAEFIQITPAGKQESHPHSLFQMKKTTNY